MLIGKALEQTLQGLGDHVCPLLKRDPRRRRYHVIGTGTLYEDERGPVLVTARHVLEELDGEPIVVGGDKEFVRFHGGSVTIEYAGPPTVDADVAVVRLPDAVKAALSGRCQFCVPSDVGDFADYDKLILYAFVGYPHTKNKPKYERTAEREMRSMYYLVREFAPLDALASTSKTDRWHVAFHGPFKEARTLEFTRIQPPAPRGISGGGVWKVEIQQEPLVLLKPKLVGIGIEHSRQGHVFVATRVEAVLAALRVLHEKAQA